MWLASGTNCPSKDGAKAAFSSHERASKLRWWDSSRRKKSWDTLPQKHYITNKTTKPHEV